MLWGTRLSGVRRINAENKGIYNFSILTSDYSFGGDSFRDFGFGDGVRESSCFFFPSFVAGDCFFDCFLEFRKLSSID